jgi:hypothetical protein
MIGVCPSGVPSNAAPPDPTERVPAPVPVATFQLIDCCADTESLCVVSSNLPVVFPVRVIVWVPSAPLILIVAVELVPLEFVVTYSWKRSMVPPYLTYVGVSVENTLALPPHPPYLVTDAVVIEFLWPLNAMIPVPTFAVCSASSIVLAIVMAPDPDPPVSAKLTRLPSETESVWTRSVNVPVVDDAIDTAMFPSAPPILVLSVSAAEWALTFTRTWAFCRVAAPLYLSWASDSVIAVSSPSLFPLNGQYSVAAGVIDSEFSA